MNWETAIMWALRFAKEQGIRYRVSGDYEELWSYGTGMRRHWYYRVDRVEPEQRVGFSHG